MAVKAAATQGPQALKAPHRHSPHIFVTAVGQEVEGTQLTAYGGQVEAQKQGQHLHEHPYQCCACTQAQHLWGEPAAMAEGRSE